MTGTWALFRVERGVHWAAHSVSWWESTKGSIGEWCSGMGI